MANTLSVFDKLRRDARLPPLELAAKAARLSGAILTGPYHLRKATQLGPFVRTFQAPIVRNQGRMEIGAHCAFKSTFTPIVLETGPRGVLTMGAGCHVNFGALISAERSIALGDEVHVAPFCIIADSDGAGDARPISIGSRAWLASRVTVLPGAQIGAGAVISAGSVVSGVIPPDMVASGIPARIVRRKDAPRPPKDEPVKLVRAAPPEAAMLLTGDREIAALKQALDEDAEPPALDARLTGESELVVAWTSPAAALPSFAHVQRLEEVPDEVLAAEVDAFARGLAQRFEAARAVLVPTWNYPWEHALFDTRPGGVARALAFANLRLMDALRPLANLYALAADHWPAGPRVRARDLGPAARELKAAVRLLSARSAAAAVEASP